MRKRHSFLTVWAAVALCACAAWAADLKPFQKAALERVLAALDPAVREMARPQLEQTFAAMNEDQIKLMLASMANNESDQEAPAEEEAPPQASAEDLAYNRAQYEPAIRKAWTAQKAFDDYVDARLAAECPKEGTYAVWGQAWRYEVMPLGANWQRASQNVDQEVQIIGASYAPQDGRYRFDFSDVRTDFDRSTVAAAITAACSEYKDVGQKFMAAARAGMSGDMLPNGNALENNANGKVSAISQKLTTVLQSQAPSGNGAIYHALMNGKRIN